MVIRESSSPYASPIVLVRKKDGTPRLCVDYRQLNAKKRKDAFPSPALRRRWTCFLGLASFQPWTWLVVTTRFQCPRELNRKQHFAHPLVFSSTTEYPLGCAMPLAHFNVSCRGSWVIKTSSHCCYTWMMWWFSHLQSHNTWCDLTWSCSVCRRKD